MTRSRRKHPITGNLVPESEKAEKQRQHRSWRVAVRSALAAWDFDRARYDVRQSVWWWPKDGRHDWTGTDYEAQAYRK